MMNEMDGIVNNLGKSRNFPDMIAKNDTWGMGQVGALVLSASKVSNGKTDL
jgi:hypothetical protein